MPSLGATMTNRLQLSCHVKLWRPSSEEVITEQHAQQCAVSTSFLMTAHYPKQWHVHMTSGWQEFRKIADVLVHSNQV